MNMIENKDTLTPDAENAGSHIAASDRMWSGTFRLEKSPGVPLFEYANPTSKAVIARRFPVTR